jgi:hypothetical protein
MNAELHLSRGVRPMIADILEELRGQGAGALAGIVLGGLIAWLYARWVRFQQRRQILRGDARDTVVIHQHLVEMGDAPAANGTGGKLAPVVLRIRSVGQASLDRVVPNGHLASELRRRAFRVTPRDTLIGMDGPEGSYLLETLTNFLCDRVANSPFEHDLYVMAPCCDAAGLAVHQPITILLISVADLTHFASWPVCRNIQVEHGSDGARILTLMELAQRFQGEQEKLADLRQTGKRTKYVETMYVLDLALDKRSATIPVKAVPWGRFEDVLKQMNLE